MSNRRISLVALALAATVATTLVPRAARAIDWSSHGLNRSHQRLTAERSGAAFRGDSWTFTLPETTASVSSPAVADGYLVFGAFDGIVRAVGASDGQLRWQAKLGDTVYAAPAIDRGKVFVPSVDNKLYAFHLATGDVAWEKDLGGLQMSSPVVVDGAVIVAAGFPNRRVVKIDAATGETLWETAGDILEQFSNASAAVTDDQVIIGANGGHYYSFDLATGALRWNYNVEGIVNLSAPVVLDGRVFMLPGGSSRKLHAVDLGTGQPVDGWPIELPAPAADATAKLLSRDHAVSSLAAVDGKIIFDIRIDDYLDDNKDSVPDRFQVREYLTAVDAATGDVLWQRANGSAVLNDNFAVPKFWLCPTPALYQTSAGPLVAASSTLDANVRVFDPKTGSERWSAATSGPTQISPLVANGRLFFGAGGALHGALSSVNQPPSTPVLLGSDGRSISAASATLRWSPSLDLNGDAVSYQLRVGSDDDLLESWQQEITTAPGQTAVQLPVRLQAGVTYKYLVRARDSKAAFSDWSPPGSFLATDSPSVSVDGQTQTDLASALQSAAPGTVITLGAGTFNLSDTVRVPGGVTLQGAGPSRTILDARGLAVGVTLEGSAAGQPTQMSRLTVTGATIGVTLRDTRDAVLKNVIIRDNTETGVEVSSNASAQVINATLLRNKNGVKSFGSLMVKNSVLAHSHTAFWSDFANAIASRFNDTYSNEVDYRNVERGLGDFNAEVSWVDAANNDLHVLARQASTDRGDPDDDFSQEPQPNGGRINLGAFGGTDEAELSEEPATPPPTPHHGGGCALAATGRQGHGTNDAAWLVGPIFLALAFTSRSRRGRRS